MNTTGMRLKSLTHIVVIVAALVGTGFLGALISGDVAHADSSYTVQDGDTLLGIAAKIGVSGDPFDFVNAVVKLNNLAGPDQLALGQVLKLPGTNSTTSTSSSSSSSGTATVSTSTSTASSAGTSSYTVQSGDTLFGIAAKLSVPDSQQADWVASVVKLNSMSSPDTLALGQVLKVPGSGQASTAATSSNVSTTPATTTTAQTASAYTTVGANTVSSAECMVSTNPTCDYGSKDVLVVPSLNEGDSSRCGSDTIKAAVNVYDVRSDGAMGIPIADCDVVRQNFAAFPGYGGYPGTGGTTVLAGHVDYHPHYMGVFWNLKQIAIGAEIDYYDKDGKKFTYAVDWAQAISDPNYDWAGLAKSSAKESIVLITCDGTFNAATHEYDHRFVAHAVRTN